MAQSQLSWPMLDFDAQRNGFASFLQRQQGHLFPWLAVGFVLGCFAHAQVQSLYGASFVALAGVFGGFASVGLLVYWRSGKMLFSIIALFLAFISLGIVCASFSSAKKSPPLESSVIASITGTIESLETHPRGWRLVVVIDEFYTREAVARPKRIRFTTREINPKLKPGMQFQTRGQFYPPPLPVSPFGYQFGSWAHNRNIQAVGYSFVSVEPVDYGQQRVTPQVLFAGVRLKIAERISTVLEGDKAGLVVALTTGRRDQLSESARDDLRLAGLAHILAISGLHMALLSGGIFWVLRQGLALVPQVSSRFNTKKWAAIAALVAACIYLGLSGASVATQRAFIMVSVAFIAMIVDRPALSMRNLAIAALIVAGLYPTTVLEPGFQMSFAATAALIAVYKVLPTWLMSGNNGSTWQQRGRIAHISLFALRLLALTLLTSTVAGLATAPIAAYHFERLATYSLLGNLLVMPWFSFMIMPMIVGVLSLMPFGLEALPLLALNVVLEPLFAIAHWVASLPGSLAPTGRLNGLAIAVLCMGAVVLMLLQGKVRLIGFLGLISLGFVSAPRYDVYISGDGKSMIARMADGDFARVPQRGSDFAYDVWLGHEGQGARLKNKSFRFRRSCEQGACVLQAHFGQVAMAETAQAICNLPNAQDLVLIVLKQPEDKEAHVCSLRAAIITLEDLGKSGALALKADNGTFLSVSARQTLGEQAWTKWQTTINHGHNDDEVE